MNHLSSCEKRKEGRKISRKKLKPRVKVVYAKDFVKAAEEGNKKAVELFLREEGDVDARESHDGDQSTALMKASEHGHSEIVKLPD